MTEPYTGESFRCWGNILKDGESKIAITDLIFVNGVPFAVLEWVDVPGGQAPSVIARLHQHWLSEPHPQAKEKLYCYQAPIEWAKA